ncbi:hypothetical protein ACU686_05885 [Yinghuangia aomiensis]
MSEGVAKDHKAVVGSTVNVTFPGGQSMPLKVVAVQKDDEGGFGFGNASTLSIADVDKADPGTHDFLVMFNGKEGRQQGAGQRSGQEDARPVPAVQGARPVRLQGPGQGPDQLPALPDLRPARPDDHHRHPRRGEHPGPVGRRTHPRDRPHAAIGASRRQIKRMIKLEAIAIAVFAALIGLALEPHLGCGAPSGSWPTTASNCCPSPGSA